MRRPSLRRLALAGLATAAAAAASPTAARAAPPSDPPPSVRGLSDPSFSVRRAAEARLEAEGRSAILDAIADEDARARFDAWTEALDACRSSEDPALSEAADRILRRIEAAATDDQVRTSTRMLRIRLERLVPQLLHHESGETDDEEDGIRFGGAGARLPAADVAYASVRGLFPDARLALVAILESSSDPRRLAGALAALCSESGDGPDDDRTLEALARAYAESPARFAGLRDLDAAAGGPPTAVLALALALSGRSDAVAGLGFSDFTVADTFTHWLRAHLKRRGLGDLGLGAFLDRVLEIEADDEAEAARRALDADLPWLARLTARRALFLAPAHPHARATLAAADRALGLLGTAAIDAGLEPGDAKDAPEAVAVDEGLRSGRLSQRLAWQAEAGETTFEGLAPVAIAGTPPAVPDRLFFGALRGRVFVVEAATGTPLATLSTTEGGRISGPRIPRAIAAVGSFVATVTSPDGRLILHAEKDASYEPVRVQHGPFLCVAATKDGVFWALASDGGLHRVVGRGPIERRGRIEGTRDPGSSGGVSLFALDGGALLLVTRDAATRVDPATGATTVVVRDAEEGVRAGPHGDDVLVAQGDRWRRFGADGALRGEGSTPDGGAIMGLAGDPTTSTIYLCLMDALVAIDADTGTVRWVEHVGGSGTPRVGAGLVAVSAGTGIGEHGDNRVERTIYALSTGTQPGDPFGPTERATTVKLAVAAAREGRPGVALALVDPLREWLLPAERERVDVAIQAARQPVPGDSR